MTRKLFWEDMYLNEFDAVVISSNGNRVVLDRTAFYPQGGGLVSDTGTIDGIRVIDVVKEDENIIHFLEGVNKFDVGKNVHCALDWARRYSLMKMHTAAHLLSSVIHKKSGALIKLANAAPPNEEILRVVKIGEIDMQADGGVHVKNTKEIGKVILTKLENKGKANKRIYYRLG